MGEHKNILLVMVDCLRADVCYGLRGTSVTPNLDRMRREGTAFTRMMSVTSTTTPNVASVFTGVYPFRHGIRSLKGYKIASDIPTLTEVLKEVHGYNNYGYISGPIRHQTGLDRGFDVYRVHSVHDGETIFTGWFEELKKAVRSFRPPWFCYIHLWDLHSPRQVLREYDNRRYGRNLYERSLSSIDSKLGELLSLCGDDTVAAVTGDHGENYMIPLHCYLRNKMRKVPLLGIKPSRKHPLYEHGYGLYEFLINIPLILRGPGIPAGVEVGALSSQVDFMPTFLDIADIDPAGMDAVFHGRDLVPTMGGGEVENRPVYLEAVGRNIPDENSWLAGIRTEDYKYIYAPRNPSISPLLFDMRNDLLEENDLSGKMPEVAAELRESINSMENDIETAGMRFLGEQMSDEEMESTEEQLRLLGYLD